MTGTEEVVHVWREWGIQALVLLSFTLQLTLLILANFRRHVDSGVLRFFIWSAYMLADSTAIYVLGHMAVTGRSREHELTAFWAPFLLMHLGGQDNITAYAIEDNTLWLRHLQTLAVQVAAAAYVLYESSILGSRSLLRPATIIMFVVGVVKYGERVWALWRAGRTQAGGSNYSSVERIRRWSYLFDLQRLLVGHAEYYIASAHITLYIAHDVLLERGLPARDLPGPDLTLHEAYHVAEVQLSLMHDLFYTKTVVTRSWHGISIHIISVLASATALLLILLSGDHKDFHSTLDVAVTYIVLVGAIIMEIVSVVRVTFSSWVWWKANFSKNCCLRAVMSLRRLVRAADWRRKCSWSRSMGQHNMLSMCARSRASRSSKVARWMGVEDPWNILAYSWSVPITNFIRNQMVVQSTRIRRWEPVGIINVQGQEELRRWGLYEKLDWSVEESILVWHVATDLYLCWYKQKATTSLWEVDASWQANAAKAVEALSNYMLFLLAYSSAEDLASSLQRLRDALNTGSPPVKLEDTAGVIGRSDSAIPITAAQLGAKLVVEEAGSSSGKMLKLILELWMEMLLYVGDRCSAYSHAKQLGNGGELVTVAALLVKQFFWPVSSAPCLETTQLQLPFPVKHHQPKRAHPLLLLLLPGSPALQLHFGHMAPATKPCHAKPKQLLPLPGQIPKAFASERAETERPSPRAALQVLPPMAEEWPLELSLAALGAQGSSSSAGEGTSFRPAPRRRGRPSAKALFAELRALLPNIDPSQRLNQEDIVDAAVAQVKLLQDTAAVLEAYRGVRAPRRPEVAVAGATVCFSVRLPPAARGALRRVLEAFARRGVEVLAATLARHGGGVSGAGVAADAVVTVTAAAAPPEVLEMIRADIACIH
ncbi:hypothetical protein EJB05_01316, partial [Eragrostis curvula]